MDNVHVSEGKGNQEKAAREERINEGTLAVQLLSFPELHPQVKHIKIWFAKSKSEHCTETISGESS